jgi:hypothetical protein
MRASRSRAVLSAVSHLVRDQEEGGDGAYGRTLLAKVPSVLLQKGSSEWTPRQCAFVLQCVAHNLPLLQNHQWLEFTGLVERMEIVQRAIDTLLSHAKDSASSEEWAHAVAILTWHESIVYEAKVESEKDSIATAIGEIAQKLGGAPDWRKAVAWLQQHRSSSFTFCTLTRLRLTWRWLARACLQNTAASLSDALESVEYALRRFAPPDDTRFVRETSKLRWTR